MSVAVALRAAVRREGASDSHRRTERDGCRHERLNAAFTLLEMCMVLFIIALLFAVTMPAMQSAYSEHAVREDSHQLASWSAPP
ncbi:MAG: prepilin-type N-terminal cleavage/methylation domain-containing protein [Verrucomicrobiota bacterium]